MACRRIVVRRWGPETPSTLLLNEPMPTQDTAPDATPPSSPGDTSAVIGLQLPEQYRAARPNVYPSPDAFRWFVRQHRAALVEAGALVAPTGRLLVSPEAFDRVVLSVGPRRAARVR